MSMEDMEKRLAALEERVQATEDIEAIKQLHYRYMNGFTQAKWDEVLSCFAEDATIDIAPSGKAVGKGMAEIKRQYGNMAKVHIGKEVDFVIHPQISVKGNKGQGQWLMYFVVYTENEAKQQYFGIIQGIYIAEYVKVNGQWKFSFLQHRPRVIEASQGMRPPEN